MDGPFPCLLRHESVYSFHHRIHIKSYIYALLYSYPAHWQVTEVHFQYAFAVGQALCLPKYPEEREVNPVVKELADLQHLSKGVLLAYRASNPLLYRIALGFCRTFSILSPNLLPGTPLCYCGNQKYLLIFRRQNWASSTDPMWAQVG